MINTDYRIYIVPGDVVMASSTPPNLTLEERAKIQARLSATSFAQPGDLFTDIEMAWQATMEEAGIDPTQGYPSPSKVAASMAAAVESFDHSF
jgi:hypothetical protein